ncbi:AAA family ATPase [Gemmatimonas sp.]|uniref:AAA family ATPase n=1 Tax=Gemmatimonas sp. TaxID=1962908 RepID=UPI003DA36C77
MRKNPQVPTKPDWLPAESMARPAADIARDKSIVKAQPLVPYLLYRGRTTLLVAPPKTGKTTLVWQVISALATGTEVFDSVVPESRVLVLALEEALGDTKDRLIENGLVKRTNVFVLSDHFVAGRRPFEVLEANVTALKPDVIVIDTLSVYAQSEVASENDAASWLAVLPELNTLAHRLDVAILLIHHTDKTGNNARGSTTICAVPDNLTYLSEAKGKPGTERVLSWKGRQSKVGSMVMDFDPSIRKYRKVEMPETATASDKPARPAKTATSVQQRLVDLMKARTHPDGALYADLRKQAKAKGETVDSTLKAMVAEGSARKTRDGRAYRYAVVN